MIENRLISVTVNSQVTLFTYDADGNRVKSVMGTETTLFIGGHYEVTNPGSGQTVTKYYFAGTQRVAMRKYTIPTSMAVEYFLGDHLGSTSVTTNSAGTKVSEVRYKPWGEIRSTWTSGIVTTPAYKLAKYLYTGQFSYMDDPTTAGVTEGFGLMFYNARWYDPYLNHFTQPDSIIPDPYNPQDWNRYSYARNNPVRYNDPSGHLPCWTCGLTSGFLAFFGLAPDYRGIAMAEALVTNGDTIIAAGMAVQSQWYIKVWDDPSNPAASSYGPAQIVQAEIEKYELSNQDLHDPTISVKVMTSRIDNVVSACPNCIDRDKFILAALAQNGSEYALNAYSGQVAQ